MVLAALLGAAAILTGVAAPSVRAQDSQPTVQSIRARDLKEVLAAHKGKGVVVNLWATWCPPCVAEFPDLVKLHQTYKDKGITVIAVSLDEVSDRQEVVSFIAKQKAPFPVYMREGGSVESLVNVLDRGWGGSIPTTYLFDRNGKRVGKALVGKRTYEQFEAAIQPLLK